MEKLKWTLQLVLLALSLTAYSKNLDSLVNVLKNNDLTIEGKLKIYDNLSWDYLGINVDKAKSFGRQGIKISLKEKNDKMSGILYHHLGIACYNNGETDSAFHYFQTAELYSTKAKDTFRLNRIWIAYEIIYATKKEYNKAIDILLQLIRTLEKGKDGDLLRTAYGNLGTLYNYIHNYTLAEKYYQLCSEESLKAKDDWKLSQSYNGLMDISFAGKDYKKAMEYADKAMVVAERCGDFECQALTNRKKSEIYLSYFNDTTKALQYASKGLEIARGRSDKSVVSDMLVNLSNICFRTGNYKQSLKFATEALQTDTTDANVYENIALNLTRLGIQLNENDLAPKYLNKYIELVDARNKKEVHQISIDSENKYQTEKKELQIAALTQQEKLYKIIGLIVGLAFLALALAVFMRFKIIRRNKQLAEQRVVQLEQEKQLVATRSLLEGEEAERSRLAGDLHDGLGGLLTGVKLKLSTMKENAIITSENLVVFNHALDLLDTSIGEMRRVAHNLMPETLMHYGLHTALSDFVNEVKPQGLPRICFTTYGENLRYKKELETTVYRATQELVNNALKHAQANDIQVELFTEPQRICLQVTDNGIGFDRGQLNLGTTCKGLKNISDRVAAFQGKFEILSEPGKGTESIMEFLIS
jgi:two-component system, NarL family, sensor kinase